VHRSGARPCPRPLTPRHYSVFYLIDGGAGGRGRSKGAYGAAKTNQARAVSKLPATQQWVRSCAAPRMPPYFCPALQPRHQLDKRQSSGGAWRAGTRLAPLRCTHSPTEHGPLDFERWFHFAHGSAGSPVARPHKIVEEVISVGLSSGCSVCRAIRFVKRKYNGGTILRAIHTTVFPATPSPK